MKAMAYLMVWAAAALSPAVSCAQALRGEEPRAAIAELQRLIRERYVFEDKRDSIASRLETGVRSDRYAVTDAREFADRVTADLQDAGKDGHLGLTWNLDENRRLREAAAATPADREQKTGDRSREALLANHGLREMRILPGNVRYLRITDFMWEPDATGEAYDHAMRFLRGGDAVIIDLRGNGGGSASAVRYAISHFMRGDREQLLMSFTDDQGHPDQSRVLGYLPAGRLTGRPLFVLTDPFTNSAAEEFVYHVKQFRLGKLVGARTRGAANNNAFHPVGRGFVASISVFSPKHPLTGTNWEGAGVATDVDVAPSKALEAAHVEALEGLATSAGGEAGRRFKWALGAARVKLTPVRLTREQLAPYQGRFGDRVVRLEGDNLVYRREGAPALVLEPLGDHQFAYSGREDARLQFEKQGGAITGMQTVFDDGTVTRYARTEAN